MANHNFSEAHQEDRTSPKFLFDTPSLSSLTSVPPPPQYPLSALKNDSDYFNDASSLTMTPPRDQNRKQITHQSQPETQPSSSTGKSLVSSSGGTAMAQNYDTWQTQPLHHLRSNSLTSTSKFVGLIQSELDLTPWAHDTSSLLRAVSQFLSQEQQIPSRIPGGLLLLHAPMATITTLQYRALIQLLQQGDYQWSEPVPGAGIIQVLVKGGDEDDQDSRFATGSSAPHNPLSNPPDPADQAALLRYYQDLTAKLLQERADMELAAKLRLQEEEEDPQYYRHSQSRHSLKSNRSNRTTSDLTSRRNAVKVLAEQQQHHHHQYQHSISRRSSASSLSSNAEIRTEQLLRQQLEDDERFARFLSNQDPNHQPGAYAVVEPDRNSSSTAPRTMTQVPQLGRPQLTASGGANPMVGIDSVAAPSHRRRLAPRPMDSSPPPALLESSSTSSFLPDEDDVALQLALKLSSHHSSNIGQISQNEESFHDQSVLSRDTSTITQVPSVNTNNKQNDGHEMDDNDDIAFQIALELSREHSPEEVPHLRERLTALGLPPELLSKNPIR